MFLFALAATTGIATTPAIIPLPQQMQVRPGVFTLCPSPSPTAAPGHPLVNIYTDAASLGTGDYLAEQLFKSTGQQFTVAVTTWNMPLRNGILLTTANANTNLNREGYEFTIAPDSVVIRGPTTAGVFYGVQTLLQLLPPQVYATVPASNVAWTVPCLYIYDQPQYSWRGVMLDTARHFITKDQIKRVLDAMAMHKLNVFHWHLTDDQGWRLEITNYPALTTNSAWRAGMDYSLNPRSNSNTNSIGQYGGFYTQAQAREIVAYAQQLHITVVPEIELPCHATAGLAAIRNLAVGMHRPSITWTTPISIMAWTFTALVRPERWPFLKRCCPKSWRFFPANTFIAAGTRSFPAETHSGTVTATMSNRWKPWALRRTAVRPLLNTSTGFRRIWTLSFNHKDAR